METLDAIKLRVAIAQDVGTVLNILKEGESEYNHVTNDPAHILREINSSNHGVYMITDHESEIGVVIYEGRSEYLVYIEEIGIRASYRRHGVGTHILGTILTRFKKMGFEIAELETHPENPALRLYKKLGFEIVGHVANSRGTGTPRKVLQRKLG